MFPSSMLARLYVKGSLKNTDKGFSLKLKNMIDSGTIVGLGPLGVDEHTYGPEMCTVKIGATEVKGDQITSKTLVRVGLSMEIFISVEGPQLQPGEHKLSFQIFTREAGRLQFTITETLV